MAAILPIVNAGATLAGLLIDALGAAQKYAALQAQVAAEGRQVTVADLKQLRAADGTVDAQLEAAIVAHGG